ncbi:MAG: serine hydrolase [Bacteroidetes bacterium]|nr:MAG: serine hydrolase [Bacteroidota bacterium]
MKRILTIIALICFSLIAVSAQTKSIKNSPPLVEALAETVGMSSERLSLIDKMCQEAIANNSIPGVVALVARHGKIVYHKAFGNADASGKALKRDDIFRIASQSKAITATAVMMLWEEGRFGLDEPISNYIPEFKDGQVLDSVLPDGTYETTPVNKPVTIRHLLSHTSGLGYGVIDGDSRFRKMYKDAGITDLFTTEPISIGESVKKLAKLPLHHHPGEKFTYSEGLDVLGYFIEIVSGMPFDEFLRKRIFDPLKMDDTWFYLPESKQSRLVKVQTKTDDKWVNYPTTFYDPDYPIKGAKTFFSGGAGLSSTAKDYATFLQMYVNNGELNGTRILSRTTIKFMLENQIGETLKGAGIYYGLAFAVVEELEAAKGGNFSEGTFQWGGYFNTQYHADPEEGLIVILMKQTQAISGDTTAGKFRILASQAIDD